MRSFSGVAVEVNSLRRINAPIDYGIVQRVRGGVLIESYRLNGLENADNDAPGPSMLSVLNSTEINALNLNGIARLLLQFDADMPAQNLEQQSKDLAAALYFRPDTPGAGELRSKYVFLPDMKYQDIAPGRVYELDFVLGDVAEITGLNVVSTGKLNATIRCAYLGMQAPDGTEAHGDDGLPRRWGVTRRIEASTSPQRVAFDGLVTPLTLTVQTASSGGLGTGAKRPINLTVGYYDSLGYLTTDNGELGDMNLYLQSGSGFTAGSTDKVQLLIPDCTEVRYLEFAPGADGGGNSWQPEKLSAQVGLFSDGIERKLGRLVETGDPLTVVLADIMVIGAVTLHDAPKKTAAPPEGGEDAGTQENPGETAETPDVPSYTAEEGGGTPETISVTNGETASVLLDSGGSLSMGVRVTGSTEGYTAKLEKLNPVTGATGPVRLIATHNYTEERLAELYGNAHAVTASEESSDEERIAAQRVLDAVVDLRNTEGSYDNTNGAISFKPPRNFTGETKYYRITVASKESEDILFTVDVTVASEPELLTAAVASLETAQTNRLMVQQMEAAAAAKAAEEAKAMAEAAMNMGMEGAAGGGEGGDSGGGDCCGT